jgi:hypothetical protein
VLSSSRGTCDDQSASFLTTATLHWQHSSSISLSNVTVQHVGGYAIWADEGSHDMLISRCTMTDLGAGGARIGVPVSGMPSPNTLAQNITITDCTIHDGGHVIRYANTEAPTGTRGCPMTSPVA